MKLSEITKPMSYIGEAEYSNAIGFEELMRFYRKADNPDVQEFEHWMEMGNKHKAWNVIKRVLRITWNL